MYFILRNSLFESNLKSDKYSSMLFWTIIFYSISVIDLYKFKFETLIEITLTVKPYCDKETSYNSAIHLTQIHFQFSLYRKGIQLIVEVPSSI